MTATLVLTPQLRAQLQAWLAFGGLALRLQQPALAERMVAEVVRRFPGEPRVALLRASQLREAGKTDEARRALAEVGDVDALAPELRTATPYGSATRSSCGTMPPASQSTSTWCGWYCMKSSWKLAAQCWQDLRKSWPLLKRSSPAEIAPSSRIAAISIMRARRARLRSSSSRLYAGSVLS